MQEGGALLRESSSPHALTESRQSAEYSGTSSGKSGKSKKRERPDQTVTASKKGELNEEYASPQKRECTENVSDKDGGLVTAHDIDELIMQMRQEQAPSQRMKLVGIMATTKKEDCSRKFVQMGGVAILDEWIQDGFNSKPSDASSNGGDKGLDEEMLTILQVLEKLPIDLEALKGCSIGKSVKRLRSSKNGGLQKKARKLVDTWRKRVDFEMNQSSMMCGGAPEHSAHPDSTSRSSDLSPARAGEGADASPTVPVEVVPKQEVDGAVVSTLSNASTSDASPQAREKSNVSADKDAASRKTARLSSASGSTLSPAKRHKHATAFSADRECKEETVNATDSQNLKERDAKGESSAFKNEPNSNAASALDMRKTNDYRKKLRSGGSSAAPSGGDLLALSGAAQARDNIDARKVSADSNTGNSEQAPKRAQAIKAVNTVDSNEGPDPPGLKGNSTPCKEEIPAETRPQGGKGTERVNESCLSSQSSCTDKRNKTSLMVTFDAAKMSSQSVPQGDVAGGVHKYSTSEPELKPSTTSTAVALPKRSETADTRHNGAVEGEESCCSYDNAAENAKRGSAECPSSDAKDAGLLDGVAHSESCKGIREPEKEQKMEVAKKASDTLAMTHSCHEFDLNEGLAMEEFLPDSQLSGVPHGVISSANALAGSVKATTSTLSAPIAISAASKRAFIPPLNLMNRCDIGWKGSASTSAFRPAEPRHVPAAKAQCGLSLNEGRNVNSFDLNVADQGNLEDCPPPSGQRNGEAAHLDLNADGESIEMRGSASASERAKFLPSGTMAEKQADKRPMHDFDLNEQLDEVLPEPEMLSTSAARTFVDTILPFGGPSGHAPSRDVGSWQSAGGTLFPFGTANIPPRTDQFFTGSMNQQPLGSRQTASSTGGPPPPSYSHTAPFFGGPPVPFPATFAYSPASAGVETPYLSSKIAPNLVPSTVGGRPRPTETSLVRPVLGMSTDDLRGGNDFYAWGRSHQNVYSGSSRPPTFMSYNNATVGGGREHVVSFDGSSVLEEQMRLYQQAAVPVAPLKRKDSEYFSGVRQSTWH